MATPSCFAIMICKKMSQGKIKKKQWFWTQNMLINDSFYPRPSGYICHSVRPSVRPSVTKNWNSKFSALVLDRDPGFSRGHQSDDEDQDEVDEEEVKDDKDDNEEAEEDDKEEDVDQTIKCLTFSESQAQAELNDDDDKYEDEDVEVEDDKEDNEES